MGKFIEGNKAYLRKISLSDASDKYLTWINDSESTKGLVTGRFPTNMEELTDYIESVVRGNNAIMFAICDQESSKHIGNVKLDNFDWISGTCEFGILIGDKDYWGRGIGTEITNLVTKYAFEMLNLRKVTLSVFGNNPRAIALYKKLGFVSEGVLSKHMFIQGELVDKYYMSLFNEKG